MKLFKFSCNLFCVVFVAILLSGFNSNPGDETKSEKAMTVQSNRFELINEVPLPESGIAVTTVQISQIQATRATCSLKVAG
jgi:hypothetical protein